MAPSFLARLADQPDEEMKVCVTYDRGKLRDP